VFDNFYRLKHEQELDSKSTAIHAKLLASDQISIHQFHKVTEQSLSSSDLVEEIIQDPSAFVILFPDETSVELNDLSFEEFKSIRNVIVIDGTWSQAAAINRTEPYNKLRKVVVNPNLTTVFWRYQDIGLHCLSTIEAIYNFMKEYFHVQQPEASYDGRYDNLLFFFSYFYHLIQASYTKNPDRKYTSRHRSDYIKRE
jgi:DTW domain-containing protein YfiP